MLRRLSGFTLVELIVVITILAILGTIGFVSLQEYSVSARDSIRISDIKTIQKNLLFYNTKNNTLPLPDNFVEQTLSGSILAYQGEAGTGVLLELGQGSVILDPLFSVPYSYSIDTSKNSFQILGNFETSLSSSVSIAKTYAQKQYSDTSINTFGDDVGIVVNDDNSPIVLSGSIELLNIISEGKKYILNNQTTLSNTEDLVFQNSLKRKDLAYLDSRLVGFWDMRTLTQTGGINYMKDWSQTGLNAICKNGWTPVFSCNEDQEVLKIDVEKGSIYDGVDDSLDIGTDLAGLTEFSYVVKFNYKEVNTTNHSGLIGNAGTSSTGAGAFIGIHNETRTLLYLIYDQNKQQKSSYRKGPAIQENTSYTAIMTYKDNMYKIYLDGIVVHESSIDGYSPSLDNISIGKLRNIYFPFSGTIHEARIYNRELSVEEVQAISENPNPVYDNL